MMLSQSQFEAVVMRANLAPSVHNTQPARWRMDGEEILIAADPKLFLSVGDSTGQDAGLSCGAAVEATVLALSEIGVHADVEDTWQHNDRHSWRGHQLAARLRLSAGEVDPLTKQLEHRFTWRGAFAEGDLQLFGWSRGDTVMVLDAPRRQWLAALNDEVSHRIMQSRAFRRELLSWMRLSDGHPRYAFDGLSRAAMQMDIATARAVRWSLGPFWGLLRVLGRTKGMTAEADQTLTAPMIACFHRPVGESPVTTGRAYMRMWLEATNLGLAGWPMAALTDDPDARAEVARALGIGPDRRLVQIIRFGQATGAQPPRARRPIDEILK